MMSPRFSSTVGVDAEAQLGEQRRGEHGGFQSLAGARGGVEGAHEQLPVVAQGAANLPAGARGGQAVGAQLHQIPAARDIAAGGGDAAAGVLNEGAGR